MSPFGILKAFADGGVTGLGARPAEKSGGKASSRQPRMEKSQGNCGKVVLRVGTRMEMPSICIQEPLESRAVSFFLL